MAQAEYAIFTNMCMIEDDQGRVLVQKRLDPTWPGISFPGGHVEPGESFVEAVIREVKEETGLTICHPRMVGVKQWQRKDGSRYVVLLFRTAEFTGELQDSEEGPVFWIHTAELFKQELAPGFAETVQVFVDDKITEHYYSPDETGYHDHLL